MRAPRKSPQSRIDQLAVRDLVEQLFEANLTYDEIIATVQRETGATLTTSALSRAHQRWTADQASEAAILREIETLTTLLRSQEGVDLNSSLMALFKKKLAQRIARADATFDGASMLELWDTLVKAMRAETAKEALHSSAPALDRPALYIECLTAFTEYLSQHAPSALTALGETFDGFMDQIRKADATQTAH